VIIREKQFNSDESMKILL